MPGGQRGLATAVWISGVSLGMFGGFALGGAIAESFGWRAAFIAPAVPAIILALLIRFTVRETPRGMADGGVNLETNPPGASETLTFFRRQTALRHAIYGLCVTGLAVMGPVFWLIPYLVRSHGAGLADAGLMVGLIIGITGVLGAPIGGYLMDRLGRRDIRWHAWILCLLMATSTVPMAVVFLTNNLDLAYAACFAWNLLGTAIPVISIALVSNLAAAQFRGLTVALLLVAFNLVGHGVGAQLVGATSDWLDAVFGLGDDALRYACTAMLAFTIWSLHHFAVAARHLREGYDLAAALDRNESKGRGFTSPVGAVGTSQ